MMYLHNQMLYGSFFKHPLDPRFNESTNKCFAVGPLVVNEDYWSQIAAEINNREVYERKAA